MVAAAVTNILFEFIEQFIANGIKPQHFGWMKNLCSPHFPLRIGCGRHYTHRERLSSLSLTQ